jgi:S-adenosylmethionine:tRNA ribosyltransferase-isomerase
METLQFNLPPELEAHQPPEQRGLRRDHVRLLVLPRFAGAVTHARFDALGDFLQPGDLLVVNTSRTLPALLKATDETGRPVEVRLSRRQGENTWSALLLDGRKQAGRAGMKLDFGEGFSAEVIGGDEELSFLWQVRFDRCCGALIDQIYRQGLPVHYDYVAEALPLDLYQTVYAGEPGSAEMPSAGRAFSWELLFKLRRQGIDLATLSLHTGLSSTRDDALDASHPVYPEEYEIPLETARAINAARRKGSKVVAVGALLTGLHEPHASHLDLLSAFVEPVRLQAAYQEAIERGYLWHEFGDMNLIY